MRDFRRDISKELAEIFQKHAQLVITRNNEDRAYVAPVQMMSAIDQIANEIDISKLMAHGDEKDSVVYLLFEHFIKKIKSDGVDINNIGWLELKNYYLDRVLLETYPPEHQRELASAGQLWITGTNLRRIIPLRFKELRQILARGGTVAAIFVDPDSENSQRYAAMQEQGAVKEIRGLMEYQSKLIEEGMKGLKKLYNEVKLGKMLIYKIDYPLGFGLDVIDGEDNKGIIYVRHYPFADDGQPVLRLTRDNEVWYRHYLFQLERLRAAAVSVNIDEA
jgi:hypothetical protein